MPLPESPTYPIGELIVRSVVAVCGLGGHAYGSFRNKQDHHMWLRDSLPDYVTSTQTKRPMARIMTYGYKSPVRSSESFASLEDLANSFYGSLSTIVTQKPLVLIGHSLGGLVVKQVRTLLYFLLTSIKLISIGNRNTSEVRKEGTSKAS